MKPTQQSLARKPRTLSLIVPPTGMAALVIRAGKLLTGYWLEEIPTDFGPNARGFELRKPDGTVYHVLLHGPASTCDCIGHLAHRHCKHLDSLTTLLKRGELPAGIKAPAPCNARHCGLCGDPIDPATEGTTAAYHGDCQQSYDSWAATNYGPDMTSTNWPDGLDAATDRAA